MYAYPMIILFNATVEMWEWILHIHDHNQGSHNEGEHWDDSKGPGQRGGPAEPNNFQYDFGI